jgi:hypothetical protein
MKKSMTLLIVILGLLLAGCGSASPAGNFTNSAAQPSGTQGGSSTGLSPALQVAIGTLKLDKTTNEITAKQATDLLPLWETLQVLESSDTAAAQEKEALIAQIQETMTKDQMQTIAEMGLTRQDMLALLQAQGQTFASNSGQNRNSANSGTTRRNFGNGGGGGFFVGGGGPPPDGSGFGGGNFQGQGTRTQSTNNGTTTNSNRRQFTTDPNRIPTPLIQAVIEYLKNKAGPSYP